MVKTRPNSGKKHILAANQKRALVFPEVVQGCVTVKLARRARGKGTKKNFYSLIMPLKYTRKWRRVLGLLLGYVS